MSDLTDLIRARRQLVERREQLTSCDTAIVDNELRTRNATARLQELQEAAADPNAAAMRAFRRRELDVLPVERERLEAEHARLVDESDALDADVRGREASEPPLWASTDVPVVLCPVRIETAFTPADRGSNLLVRIYPDDLHLDSTPAPLTDREHEAGAAYWRALWPAIGTGAALEPVIAAAWETLGRQIDPERMAFVAEATRPENAPRDLTTPPLDAAPRFPPRQREAGGGTRAALMPDAWTVYGFRDGELLFRERGKPIPLALPLSALRPRAEDTRPAGEDADEAPREWLVDFAAAREAGMALSIPLDESITAIDHLFVLGVRAEAEPTVTAQAVTAALASHARRGALEYLPPGAPTNNTTDASSAWHSGAAPATSPHALEIQLDPESAQNGARVAVAFGLDGPGALGTIPGATADWQTSPGTMIDALWPGLTVDWDMLRRRDMNFAHDAIFPLAPVDEAATDGLRRHAAAFVRNRGPLPTLRIRREPYGLLPVSALDAWTPTDGDATEALATRLLRHLRPFWLASTGDLPRAGSGKDQDAELAGVLTQDAVSTALVFRSTLGTNESIIGTSDSAAPLAIVPDVPPNATLLCHSVDADPRPYSVDFVSNPTATVAYWTTRREIVEACLAAPPMDVDTIDTKIQFHLSTHAGSNPPLTRSLLYALFGYGQLREGHEAIPPEGIVGGVDAFWRPRAERQLRLLQALERIPAEELALLTAETVDLFSHRLDAWITSLATRRLGALRALRPRGCHLGGFGWVESLTLPTAPPPVLNPPPAGFTEVVAREEDTYVLAPSLHHAASAAVLRAGFDSHTDEQAFGVNLVSARSRTARWMIDGVRNGQPLGALLGYWIERALHDARKDDVIDDVRLAFPAPIVPDPDDEGSAAAARETIAVRNVVDGLALYKAVSQPDTPSLTPEQRTALAGLTAAAPAVVADLRDIVDALGDLVLAESVHQLVGGNPMRAGLAADTLGRGESLPSRFDMIESPRGGVGLTCGVAVVMPAIAAIDTLDWSRERPRARLAPQAEAWAASILGRRASWRIGCQADGLGDDLECRLDDIDLCALDVVFEIDPRAAGGAGTLERRILARVRERDGIVASIALATGARANPWILLTTIVARIQSMLRAAQPLQPSHLDPLGQYPDPVPGAAAFDGLATAASASDTAAIEALTAATQALASASPDNLRIRAGDVAIAAAIELAIRATHFLAGLQEATTELRTRQQALTDAVSPEARLAAATAVTAALAGVADHGIDNSYPLSAVVTADDAVWVAEQGRLVLERLTHLDPPTHVEMRDDMSVRGWIERATQILSAVAGERFPVLAALVALPGGELATSLARSQPVKGANLPDIMTWLRRLARVRPAVSDFHDLMLSLEMGDRADAPSLRVIQAPSTGEADVWAVDTRPASAQRTAVLQVPSTVDGAAPLCGWLIDAWIERIPGLTNFSSPGVTSKTELAGLTFHYNQPDARAPHAILIAVPPDLTKPWTEEMLLHVVEETFDLAKIRSIEHRDLPRRTPVIPMGYVLHGALWPQEMDPQFTG